MTIQELQAQVNSSERVTRADIQLALDIYNDAANAESNISLFLDGCPFVTKASKGKILGDLLSYRLSL
jgi:hypothetical protein